MLEIYAKEFVNICGFISKKIPEQVCDTYMYIQPTQLRAMMNKNKFDESESKLHIWRALGWLLCEPDRLTKHITVNKRSKRVCVLNKPAYLQLSQLLEKKRRSATPDRAGESSGQYSEQSPEPA